MPPYRRSHRYRRRALWSSKKSLNKITCKSVNLLKNENTILHHTEEYETNELVIRRGFKFKLLVTFSRKIDENEKVQFELQAGSRPSKRWGSLVPLLQVDPKAGESVEGVRILSQIDNVMSLEVHTSPTETKVGKWTLAMRIGVPTASGYLRKNKTTVCNITDKIIVVFNPWCKEDPVYMEDDSWRQEYVLNEEGLQYYGTSRSIGNMDWYYGQFEEKVMKAVLILLDKMKPKHKARHDPVLIARSMSALVNSSDDNGVLEGNWSGDYSGGDDPSNWIGSVSILSQYVSQLSPVKYGQCWVFSGVFTTVMRCLGIPCRSLTTFDSAHDTDANLTIDHHYDHNYKPIDNDDSVWNFHVWNDVWTSRNDLPIEGMGGWQAIDATPQETSGGKFRCGPMSVQAIKQGRVDLDYDGKFIYAEVNASKKYWMKLDSEDGEKWVELECDDHSIGRCISTKCVGSYRRHDITQQYKHAEGSIEERLSFENARKYVKLTHTTKKKEKYNLKLETSIPDSVEYGKDIRFNVKVTNLSGKKERVHISCVTKSTQYNGSALGKLTDVDEYLNIGPQDQQDVNFFVESKNYLNNGSRGNSVKVDILCGVTNANEVHSKQALVDFVKPKIKIEVLSKQVRTLQPIKINMSFRNPLSTSVSGIFTIEGAGIREAVKIPVDMVKAHELCNVEASITPKRIGNRRLIVAFQSQQLSGIQGCCDLSVA